MNIEETFVLVQYKKPQGYCSGRGGARGPTDYAKVFVDDICTAWALKEELVNSFQFSKVTNRAIRVAHIVTILDKGFSGKLSHNQLLGKVFDSTVGP